MATKKPTAMSAAAWRLARRQHGTVARRQLLALGFTPAAIRHRLDIGRLHRTRQGVYTVGRAELSREGRWMAAILTCAEGAFLSHRSAAALFGIGEERPGVIELGVPRRGEHHCDGIRVRRRPSLPSHEVGTFARVPVTSPARTLVDYASVVGPRTLERAVNDADKRDLIDPESLRGALDAYPREPGVKALRHLLDRDTFLLSDTELELLLRPIASAAGLPPALTKAWVNGFEVDFYWPTLGLIVETDGWRYHRTPSAQSRDALRDQTHTAAGMTPLRFSHHQVKHEPAAVLRTLTRTAAHLQAG